MPYNPLAYPYQLNTKELPANQTAAAAYLALPYASTSGAWGGPTVGAQWAQSPYYLPNWGDESQGTLAGQQAISPVATASVTRPDSVVAARDLSANSSLNTTKAGLTAQSTAITNQINAINNITTTDITVVSVTPNTLTHGVAASVAITGSGFSVSAPTVNIGGACTSVVVQDDAHLTCLTPAASVAGTSNVVVTTTGGTGTLTGGMTYT